MANAFLESVKQVFSSVFGRADYEHVLDDSWSVSDTIPEDQQAAIQKALRAGAHKRAERANAHEPLAEPAPQKPKPARPTSRHPRARGPERLPAASSVDMSMFDRPEEDLPAAAAGPAVDVEHVTRGRPHPAATAEVFGDMGFGDLHAPYPADFGDSQEDGAPAARDTLDITGEQGPAEPLRLQLVAPSATGPVAAPPERAPVLLERLAKEEEPDRAPLRLRPTGPTALPTASDSFGPDSASASDSFGAGSSVSITRRPKARSKHDNGQPPASIWDERAIRDQIVAELKKEETASSDAGHRRVIASLRRQVDSEPLYVPPFPTAAKRLLGKDGRPPTDDEVVEIVHSEPTLAGNVVKIANSPFYMAAVPVASVNAAVMRIGLDQVRRVSLAAVVGTSYEVAGFTRTTADVRLHCFATALAAETLAAGTPIDPGEAFLAGLLHDAGEVLAYALVRKAIDESKENGPAFEPDRKALRKIARRYHCRLGALFLGCWDLPASVAAAMAFHHHPDLTDPRFADVVSLIHVADVLTERALEHSRTTTWRRAALLRAPGSTREEQEEATANDGVDELDVNDLLFHAPRHTDAERLRGVARSVLLRLDSRGHDSFDGTDVNRAFASTFG